MNCIIQNILVFVDFSKTSIKAVNSAIHLANKHHAVLHLLAIDLPVNDINDNSGQYKKRNDVDLKVLSSFISNYFGVSCLTNFKTGSVVEAISSAVKELEPDLLVVGKGSKDGSGGLINESVVFQLLSNLSVPLLAIPSNKKNRLFSKVIFPVRHVLNNVEKYQYTSNMLKGENTFIHLVALLERSSNYDLGVVRQYLNYIKLKIAGDQMPYTSALSFTSEPWKEVLKAEQQTGADLIVITASTRRNLWEIFWGNYTQKILRHTSAAILCVKADGYWRLAM